MDTSISHRFPSTGNGEPPPKTPKRVPVQPADQEVDDVPTEQDQTPAQ